MHPQSVTLSPGRQALVEVCGTLRGLPRARPPVSGAVTGARRAASGAGLVTGRPGAKVGRARMAWDWQLREHWPKPTLPRAQRG